MERTTCKTNTLEVSQNEGQKITKKDTPKFRFELFLEQQSESAGPLGEPSRETQERRVLRHSAALPRVILLNENPFAVVGMCLGS